MTELSRGGGVLWHCRSGAINELIRAKDQWAAWDTLRDRPVEDFGILASAEPRESGDPLLVRTSRLLFLWGRDDDARKIIAAAVESGLPDTTELDQRPR